MDAGLFQIVVLALIQGITEFLPISSSAHLVLVPWMLGWTDQGLAMDVAVHVGTLGAVVVYFRHTLKQLLADGIASARARRFEGEGQLAWGLLVATLPVAVCGLLFHDVVAHNLRSPMVIGLSTICFGVLLWVADLRPRAGGSRIGLGWRGLLLIGLAQALALIPGTSRSGITMTAALLLGLDRRQASHISFLLSVPVIVLAGTYAGFELLLSGQPVPWGDFLLAAGLAGSSAWLCITLFLATIQKIGMGPFVVYRLALGALLLGVLT